MAERTTFAELDARKLELAWWSTVLDRSFAISRSSAS